jgi:hypothetical protein
MSKIKKDLEELRKIDEEIESDNREGPTKLEQMDFLQEKYFFRPDFLMNHLNKMTPEQIFIFEHLTGINRQTIH